MGSELYVFEKNRADPLWTFELTRKNKLIRYFALVLLALCAPFAHASCAGGDDLRPLDAIAEQSKALLMKRDFVTLEKMAGEFRANNTLASDGQPKLMGLYAGISKANSLCRGSTDSEAQWATHRALLVDWSKAVPKSAVPKLALAKFESAYGWKARGGGYASTVTPDGWKLFGERTARAQAMLEKLETLAKDDPEWYATMLDVALEKGWDAERFDALYDKAVKKFPYYLSYYFTKGAYYSAKWRGSQEKFKAYVEEVVTQTEPKLGQTMYARLNWSAQTDAMFRNGQADWKRMKIGFEDMVKDYPDAWNRNHYGRFACMAGDRETARRQIDLVGKKIIMSAWEDEVFFNACNTVITQDGKRY